MLGEDLISLAELPLEVLHYPQVLLLSLTIKEWKSKMTFQMTILRSLLIALSCHTKTIVNKRIMSVR